MNSFFSQKDDFQKLLDVEDEVENKTPLEWAFIGGNKHFIYLYQEKGK